MWGDVKWFVFAVLVVSVPAHAARFDHNQTVVCGGVAIDLSDVCSKEEAACSAADAACTADKQVSADAAAACRGAADLCREVCDEKRCPTTEQVLVTTCKRVGRPVLVKGTRGTVRKRKFYGCEILEPAS